MIPAEIFKKLIQGDTLLFEFEFEGVNLVDATVEMLLRKPGTNVSFLSSAQNGNLGKVFANNVTTITWTIPKTTTQELLGQYEFRTTIEVNSQKNTWIKGLLDVTK